MNYSFRFAGWSRKYIFSKETTPTSNEITLYVIMFEPFVSLSIRLYQSTNAADVQCSILDLLCVLIRGGINYSMLDPETRLLNFIIDQVNEIGTRNRTASDGVDRLICSIFDYFLVLSHTESRGQVIMELGKIYALVDYLIKACDNKPHLASVALNSLQLVTIDCVEVLGSFNGTLLKILQAVAYLAEFCPTKVIQLWAVAVLGSHIRGDAQRSSWSTKLFYSWTKVSLSLFDNFQQLSAENWDFNTAFSSTALLRLCCDSIFRPIDAFFNHLVAVLDDDLHCFSRLVAALPYLFIFLCVLKEGATFTRIEQICDNAVEKIGRALMALLSQCLIALRCWTSLSVTDEESCENLVIWYLLILSHAVRSGSMRCVTDTFRENFSTNSVDLHGLSLFYPRVYVQLLAFISVTGLHDQPLFYSYSSR
ncbi:unnamed protein product [Gongylonema pulchrum]|uniref:Rif1_N domain-containing protein n=1 Tax=Gongylonema pulchrum TaxID=637853 RepID=A0A183CXJ6_9BILA|nr:unnamed protein product [Gongylonema pulchrum]